MTTTLFCLPYAGAGAGVYRPWFRRESGVLRAVPVQVPGREEEFNAPFYRTMAEAAAGTAERIRAAAGKEPFVVFGHSFGAILAYEAVRHLVATGGPLPAHLVVSGSTSPRHRQAEPLDADDEVAAAQAAAIAGREIEVFADPTARALLSPRCAPTWACWPTTRPCPHPAAGAAHRAPWRRGPSGARRRVAGLVGVHLRALLGGGVPRRPHVSDGPLVRGVADR
ncbi:thioesterase domain-containing protein [Streptomyces lydicus]|nr:thioesterase domain-containing protein [Streptomyces lydicus]